MFQALPYIGRELLYMWLNLTSWVGISYVNEVVPKCNCEFFGYWGYFVLLCAFVLQCWVSRSNLHTEVHPHPCFKFWDSILINCSGWVQTMFLLPQTIGEQQLQVHATMSGYMYPYKREGIGDLTQTERSNKTHDTIWRCWPWIDVAIIQRVATATRNWNNQRTDSPLESLGGLQYCPCLDCGINVNVWPPEMWKINCCVYSQSLWHFVIATSRN